MFKIKQNDTRPAMSITCTDRGQPVDLTVASSVRVLGAIDGTLIVDHETTGDAVGNVLHEWTTTETGTAGRMKVEVEVMWPDGARQTFPGDGYLEVDIIPDLG